MPRSIDTATLLEQAENVQTTAQQKAIKGQLTQQGLARALAMHNQYLPDDWRLLDDAVVAYCLSRLFDDAWLATVTGRGSKLAARAGVILVLVFSMPVESEAATSLASLNKQRQGAACIEHGMRVCRPGRDASIQIARLSQLVAIPDIAQAEAELFEPVDQLFWLSVPAVFRAPVAAWLSSRQPDQPVFAPGHLVQVSTVLSALASEATAWSGRRVTVAGWQRYARERAISSRSVAPELVGYWFSNANIPHRSALHYSAERDDVINAAFSHFWAGEMYWVGEEMRHHGWMDREWGHPHLSFATVAQNNLFNNGVVTAAEHIEPADRKVIRSAKFHPSQYMLPGVEFEQSPDPQRPLNPITSDGFILLNDRAGTRRMPTDKTLKQVATTLISEVKERYLKDRLRHHNALTFYVLSRLLFVSGLRPTKHFLDDVKSLDLNQGIALVSDKGQLRPLFLDHGMVQQLAIYRSHINTLAMELTSYQPEAADALRQGANAWCGTALLDVQQPVSLFQIFTPGGALTVATPGELRTYFEQLDLPIELRAFRRMSRQALSQAHKRQDELNAYMGHAQYQASNWHGFSLSAVERMATRLQPSLSQMASEHGFHVYQANGVRA